MKPYNENEHARSMIIDGLRKRGLFSNGLNDLNNDLDHEKFKKAEEILTRKETHIVEKNDPSEYEYKGGF